VSLYKVVSVDRPRVVRFSSVNNFATTKKEEEKEPAEKEKKTRRRPPANATSSGSHTVATSMHRCRACVYLKKPGVVDGRLKAVSQMVGNFSLGLSVFGQDWIGKR